MPCLVWWIFILLQISQLQRNFLLADWLSYEDEESEKDEDYYTDKLFNRIVTGASVPQKKFPWLAAIFRLDMKDNVIEKFLHCSGTLINERFVITAAHCVMTLPPRMYIVRLGYRNVNTTNVDSQHVEYKLDHVILHPLYKRKKNVLIHDLALIKLLKKVTFTEYIETLTLPSKDFAAELLDHKTVTVPFWGCTSYRGSPSLIPLSVEVNVIPNKVCSEFHERKGNKSFVHMNSLCIGVKGGVKGPCQGDSGGPIIFHHQGSWVPVSVISWGQMCTQTGGYIGSTRIAPYLNWIDEHIQACVPAEPKAKYFSMTSKFGANFSLT